MTGLDFMGFRLTRQGDMIKNNNVGVLTEVYIRLKRGNMLMKGSEVTLLISLGNRIITSK